MIADRRPSPGPRVSARLRLALSYAAFVVASGVITLIGVYLVLRYVPDYPIVSANPRDSPAILATRREIIDALIRVLALILAGLALVGVIGGWFVAGWVLRPLQRINEAAEIVATGRLDHRIRLSGRNDEFRQLADTFDHMLERLHDAFRTQERFAANASHELRTPLAVTATMLDVARTHPDGEDIPQLLERLQLMNARAIGLTEALLRLSDANAVTAVAEPVDLAAVLQEALADCEPEAQARDVGFDVDVDIEPGPAVVTGDPALLAQLVFNLVQNCVRHAAAPGRASIALRRDPRAPLLVLRTENGGRVYSPADVARLEEPFHRGVVRTNAPGAARGYGLGLALVSRVAALHGGELVLTARPEGGLIVTVTIPAIAARRA